MKWILQVPALELGTWFNMLSGLQGVIFLGLRNLPGIKKLRLVSHLATPSHFHIHYLHTK